MPTLERVVAFARRSLQRLSGSLVNRRSGYFFIWSRALTAALRQRSRDGVPPGIDSVTLEELPERVPAARYRELEPPAGDATPPPGWAWPARFAKPGGRTHAPARGQGVLEIPGGVVFGWRGQFGTDPSGLLTNASSLWGNDEGQAFADAAAALTVGLEDLDGVTMSIWANGLNYAHSLLQSVPRLELLRRAFGLEADRFLVHVNAPRPTADAIEILGLPADRIHVVPGGASPAYRCETLRAATSPFDYEFGVPWVAEFLHELFLPAPPTGGSRRLYLERGAAMRKVLNEHDVLALLEPAGFESMDMDGRSVAEQAELFASAEVVVGTHGAALANLVFCRPGTVVVELMGTNTASTLYTSLSWRRSLRYHMVMGTEPCPPDRWWTWRLDADTVVDVPALRRCLEAQDLL